MRVLLLVQKEQRIILDRFYDSIARHSDSCEVRHLDAAEQANLQDYFRGIDCGNYDRIIFFLRFKKEIRQRRFLRTVPNLVILEHDAYQNYIKDKYRGKFSQHYRALPWARVLCSGFQLSRRLQAEGFDAVFVAKGYDQALLHNRGSHRDIELGFLGSIENKTYDGRRQLLQQLAQEENLLVKRTHSGEEYADTLNRIRFFISADVGLGEYMIKNFEAMACGCVLFAWDQGAEENTALGLVDMENVVLYRSLDELRQKLNRLRTTPELGDAIAAAGQHLAQQRYSWEKLGADVVESLKPPLRQRVCRSFLGIKRYSWAPPAGEEQ